MEPNEMPGEELYHYGIKGMKWGVRRTPEELGHKTSGVKNFISKKASQLSESIKVKRDENARKKREKKGPSAMTGEELTSAISRMQQEKQYRLLKEEESKANESAFKKFLKNTGSKLLDRTVSTVLDSIFDDKTDTSRIDLSKTSLADLSDAEIAALAKREENMVKIRRNHEGTITPTSAAYRAQVMRGRGEVQSWLSDHHGETTASARATKQSKRKAQRRSSEAQNILRNTNNQSEQVQRYNNSAAEADIAAARERARQRIEERRRNRS